jgi:hypothetical protein
MPRSLLFPARDTPEFVALTPRQVQHLNVALHHLPVKLRSNDRRYVSIASRA